MKLEIARLLQLQALARFVGLTSQFNKLLQTRPRKGVKASNRSSQRRHDWDVIDAIQSSHRLDRGKTSSRMPPSSELPGANCFSSHPLKLTQ